MKRTYESQEIDGIVWRVYPNGAKLKAHTLHPKVANLPTTAGVYLIRQISTGLEYVGSSVNVQRRASNYISKLKERASGVFAKIDASDIEIELLEDCRYLNNLQLIELERYHIISRGSIYPSGFNKRCPISKKYFDGVSDKFHKKPYVVKGPINSESSRNAKPIKVKPAKKKTPTGFQMEYRRSTKNNFDLLKKFR